MRDCRKLDYAALGVASETPGGHGGIRTLDKIKFVVIHHSGVDIDNSSEEIDAYHKTLGWPGIGYHFVVRKNGDLEYAGDLATMRYNVAGVNLQCVGICLVGDFTNHLPTNEQMGATRNLVSVLMPILDPAQSGAVKVRGHREIALPGYGTECPGKTWEQWNWLFYQWR